VAPVFVAILALFVTIVGSYLCAPLLESIASDSAATLGKSDIAQFGKSFKGAAPTLEQIAKARKSTLVWRKLDDIIDELRDPDKGIYRRIRTVADDVDELRQWKLKIESRVALLFGSIVTTAVGLIGKFIYDVSRNCLLVSWQSRARSGGPRPNRNSGS
jgi:hypothetical protein